MASLNSFIVRSLWGSSFLDWVVLDAVNTTRGVLLVWDKRVFEKVDYDVGLFSVNVLLKGVADDFVWACSGVYGPNEDTKGVRCGKNLLECTLGGIRLGVF